MALKDCLRRLERNGVKVSDSDKRLLEQFIAQGMTDNEAVDRLDMVANKDIIDLAARAAQKGVIIQKRPGVLSELRRNRDMKVDQVQKERKVVWMEATALEAQLEQITNNVSLIAGRNNVDTLGAIDPTDQDALSRRIWNLFKANQDLYETGEQMFGGMIKGNTPEQVLASFNEMMAMRDELKGQQLELHARDVELVERIKALTDEDSQTFFQDIELDDLGMYSAVEATLRIMPMENGSTDQIMGWLAKQPNVTAEELEYLDLRGFLEVAEEEWRANKKDPEQKSMRQMAVEFVQKRGVVVEELVLAGRMSKKPDLKWEEQPADPSTASALGIEYDEWWAGQIDVWDVTENNSGDLWLVINDRDAGNVSVREYKQNDFGDWLPIDADINNQNTEHAALAITKFYETQRSTIPGVAGPAQYEDYTLGGGFNYRELLYRLPNLKEGTVGNHAWAAYDNVVFWMRVVDRIGPNGEKILHIEEIQSDVHAQGRERGYRDPSLPTIGKYPNEGRAPWVPFKGNRYVELALKRALRYAAENGYDQVATTTGVDQAVRYQRQDASGARTFYDQVVPSSFNKVARKLDKKARVKKKGQRVRARDGEPFSLDERMVHSPLTLTMRSIDGEIFPKRVPQYHVLDRYGTKVAGPFDSKAAAETLIEKYNGFTHEVHVMDVTPKMRDGALKGQTLYQGKKGAITFDEQGRALVKIAESHDLSTFIHESGHLYLELLRSLAEDPTAPQQIKDDWKKVLKWLGVKSSAEITREHHEMWAKGFEKYAMEGKAPSLDMQDAFSAFRIWLMAIYRKLTTLAKVPLNKDIRGVMDRMLATDEEIAEVEQQQEYAATFVDEAMAIDAGMTPEAYAVYRRAHIRSHNEAVDKATAEKMRSMNADEQEWWDDERRKVRFDVQEELHQMPLYRALAMLQRGTNPDGTAPAMQPFKLSKESLLRYFPQATINRLPRPFIYSVKGGVDVDLAATRFGFKSGLDMLEAILNSHPMDDVIEAETNARMKERYPDVSLDGSMTEVAVAAVHNEKRADILAFEMRELRKWARKDAEIVRATKKALTREDREAREANRATMPKRAELAGIKVAARTAISKKKIRDVKPHVYLNAERKAGRLAFAAAARKDYQQAYVLKRQQLMNFEMHRAAVAAKKQTDTARKYISKFESKKVQARIGRSDLLNEILTLMEGVDLRRKSLKSIDVENSLKTLREEVEQGRLIVTKETLERIFDDTVNWQELTVGEFLEMRDLIKQLEKMARKEVEAIVNGEKVLIEDAANEIATSLYENGKEYVAPTGKAGISKKFKANKDDLKFAWLRPSSIARYLDNSEFGALTQRLIVPMRRAYAERLIPQIHKAQSDVAALFKAQYTNKELGEMNRKKIRVVSQNETYSKQDIIALALNWGNENNRAAVLAGVKRNEQLAFTPAGVDEMLSHMTEKDWLFVQSVWNYIDSYWPQIHDAERRRRGVAPQKIEADSFEVTTADGTTMTMAGGYYPLKYNRDHSERTKQNELDDIYSKLGNSGYLRTSTRAGATYERVGSAGQVVRLDLNVIETHLREIVRDLTIGDEVNYLVKVLNNKDLKNAFNLTGNERALNTLELWLTDAAVGELPAEHAAEWITSWIRTGFTKSRLGWNATVVVLQFTGAAQTMAMIGSTWYARGLFKFISNPVKHWKEVKSQSQFLTTRYDVGTWDKDVQDAKAHFDNVLGPMPTLGKGIGNRLAHTYFLPIMAAQQVVDVTTWLAARDKAINKLGYGDDQAILYADAMVEGAQTSGFFSDRSGLERGTLGTRKNRQSQYIRIWTTLISYMLAKGNIAYEKTGATDFRKPGQILKWIHNMAMLFAVEGVLSALLYGKWPEEDDDLEDWAGWTAMQTLDSVSSGLPFIRETAASRFGGGNTPIGVFSNDLFDFIEQSAQGEADDQFRRSLVKVIGTAGHIPSTQFNRFFDQIWSEDEPDWWEYFVGERDYEK